MERALQLAGQAKGWSSPNPAVGAVIVRDGEVVGEGYTQPPGGPHAEIVALRQAGERARGGALYVTLEPCSHFGRTPPCTNALIAAGVSEVHAALADPSPWVNGRGLAALEANGITALLGERESEARRLNEAYFKWVGTKRPFVSLKYAMTVDGRIATRTGSSRWISGGEARGYVARLRAQVDAVLVGIGTVLADDPLLTSRPQEFGIEMESPIHQPLRVVLDSSARLPPGARIALRDLPGQTLVYTTQQANGAKVARLHAGGIQVEVLPDEDGRVSIDAVMGALGQRGITSVLAECGSTLAASLLAKGAVDKVLAFVSPKIVGGSAAPGPIGGAGVEQMTDALELADTEWTALGRDLLFTGYVRGQECPASLEA